MLSHTPLATLGILGAVRSPIMETDQIWLRACTGDNNGAFESMQCAGRGLLVAWRREGTAPEFARRGDSGSGVQHVLIAGRVESPGGSPDAFADVLEREGEQGLDSTTGPCVVLAWSERDQSHTFFRPQSGQRVLCYAEVPGGILFASDARTLIAHPEVDTAVRWDSVADHMAFGHLYGDKTLFRGVRRLAPGEKLVVSDGKSRSVQVPVQTGVEDESRASSIDRIDAALHEAVQNAWSGAERPALCLSAGLDSRTIMAVAQRQGIPLVCVTNGIEGSLELRLTRRMCETIGAEHLSCLLEEQVVDGILEGTEEVGICTDGEGTIQSANMLYLTRKYRQELGLDRVIRGIGGELLKLSLAYAYKVPTELAQSQNILAIREHLLKQLTYSANPAEWKSIQGELADSLAIGPEQSFMAEWSAMDERPTGAIEKVSQLFLRAYISRATVDSMRILRQSVDLAQPFLDERFIQTLSSTPVELRLDPSLQIELIRRNCPELLRIPNSAVHTRLDAGSLRKWVATQTYRVARRLGFGEIDVPEKWLTARLADFYCSILLEEKSLERSHINADGMRSLLSQPESGRSASSPFLGRLATFELHMRRLDDSSSSVAV